MQPTTLRLSLLLSLLSLLFACGTGQTGDDVPEPDAATSTPDGAQAPTLTCAPTTAPTGDLCGCMASIVCDQIYACLDAAELTAKPPEWSPHATCVESLKADCEEDGPENQPAEFRRCLADLGIATCEGFGTFGSVARDFPASCENLRALETALGIER